MISELQDMINVADETNNKKAKEILLKIAMLKEENQKQAVKVLILQAIPFAASVLILYSFEHWQ